MQAYLNPDKNHVERLSSCQNMKTNSTFKRLLIFQWIFKIFINLKTNMIITFVYLK